MKKMVKKTKKFLILSGSLLGSIGYSYFKLVDTTKLPCKGFKSVSAELTSVSKVKIKNNFGRINSDSKVALSTGEYEVELDTALKYYFFEPITLDQEIRFLMKLDTTNRHNDLIRASMQYISFRGSKESGDLRKILENNSIVAVEQLIPEQKTVKDNKGNEAMKTKESKLKVIFRDNSNQLFDKVIDLGEDISVLMRDFFNETESGVKIINTEKGVVLSKSGKKVYLQDALNNYFHNREDFDAMADSIAQYSSTLDQMKLLKTFNLDDLSILKILLLPLIDRIMIDKEGNKKVETIQPSLIMRVKDSKSNKEYDIAMILSDDISILMDYAPDLNTIDRTAENSNSQ